MKMACFNTRPLPNTKKWVTCNERAEHAAHNVSRFSSFVAIPNIFEQKFPALEFLPTGIKSNYALWSDNSHVYRGSISDRACRRRRPLYNTPRVVGRLVTGPARSRGVAAQNKTVSSAVLALRKCN
jgi:hypothetical protein